MINPPTDSLYKFTAISGIICLVFCSIYIVTPSYNGVDRLFKLAKEAHKLEVTAEVLIYELQYNETYQSINQEIKNDVVLLLENEVDSDFDSNLLEAVFFLSEPIKSEILQFIKDSKVFQMDREIVLEYYETTSFYGNVIFVSAILSILAIFWGFYKWIKVQGIQDTEQLGLMIKKGIVNGFTKLYCQSCKKSLRLLSEHGTEKDGSISIDFCSDCYKNGEYTEPDLTYKEARRRLYKELRERKRNKYASKLNALFMINLKRWKGKGTW